MSLLGDRLRQIREARGISPLQVEIETRIRANVIQALEEGEFDSLPPEPFLRGLIRSYSNYLGADPQEMLDLYAADFAPTIPPPSTPSPIEMKKSPEPIPTPPKTPAPATPAAPTPPPMPLTAAPAIFPAPTLNAAPPPPTPPAPATPPPPLPPETFTPPEKLERIASAEEATDTSLFLAHITRRGIPLPVIVLVGIAIILSCLAGSLVVITRVAPAVVSLAMGATATPTRIPATRTPSPGPGALPTSVPTLPVTAAPFATFPGNPTATLPSAARRTLQATTGLNLDVDVTQTITIQVGVDGALVFSGQMQPGESNSWSARNSLYVRVENPKGATLLFNGNAKWFGARNYAERTLMERQWALNDKGTPVSVEPVAPVSTPAATLGSPPVNPSPTLTPFPETPFGLSI